MWKLNQRENDPGIVLGIILVQCWQNFTALLEMYKITVLKLD